MPLWSLIVLAVVGYLVVVPVIGSLIGKRIKKMQR
jgi:hypothetical protein